MELNLKLGTPLYECICN